jgi:hypothetical protein
MKGKNMNEKRRTRKIQKLIQFLNDNGILMVEQSHIGDVGITNAVNEEFIHDNLIIESGFTKDDVISVTEFFKRARVLLISTDDICGVSFENCLLNEDELYVSNMLRN